MSRNTSQDNWIINELFKHHIHCNVIIMYLAFPIHDIWMSSITNDVFVCENNCILVLSSVHFNFINSPKALSPQVTMILYLDEYNSGWIVFNALWIRWCIKKNSVFTHVDHVTILVIYINAYDLLKIIMVLGVNARVNRSYSFHT